MLDVMMLADVRKREQPIDDDQHPRARFSTLHDELPRAFRQRRADFEPDHVAKLALLQRIPQRLLQVLALFLELDFAIAQGPEQPRVL